MAHCASREGNPANGLVTAAGCVMIRSIEANDSLGGIMHWLFALILGIVPLPGAMPYPDVSMEPQPACVECWEFLTAPGITDTLAVPAC